MSEIDDLARQKAESEAREGSPDTLPLRGYTREALAKYIYRQLGDPTWEIELTKQQVYDAVQDALAKYSEFVPPIQVSPIRLTQGRHEYLKDEDIGQGIIKVDFVEPNPVPTEIFYGNLINPAPLFRLGLDEYDTFLRWRKVWQRVTSVRPDWFYDETHRALYISNPIERYMCSVFYYGLHEDTKRLDLIGSTWVKEYSLELARYNYGEMLAKYSGAIPGPLKDLQLDNQKRQNAQGRIDKLLERVKGMQRFPDISID